MICPAGAEFQFPAIPSPRMRPNGSTNSQVLASVPLEQSRLVFDRMGRQIGRLSKSTATQNVHRFRTNSRRVEVLIDQLSPDTRNKRKAVKLLAKLRKKAGKLRDVDVQIASLKELKVPDRQNHRAQLLEILSEDRGRRARKLAKAVDTATLEELRKRLRRERTELKLDGIDPLQLAMNQLPKLGQVPLTEKTLHAFRIAAKHARYLAELAGDAPAAKVFVAELKRAQDAIGEWHDVLKLEEKAEKRFGSSSESALVSMLQNISRARFRNASNALLSALANVSRQAQPPKRPSETVPTASAAAGGAAVA